MAPENPFPGPLEDCIRVTKYILNNYEKMHLDINRYALAGDSAGYKNNKTSRLISMILNFKVAMQLLQLHSIC